MIHLLDIPAELRLEIYDRVLLLDITWQAIHTYRRLADDRRRSIPIPPWRSVLLVCRQIHNELKKHIESRGSETRSIYNTWVVHMQTKDYTNFATGLKLPCASSQLKAVEVRQSHFKGTQYPKNLPNRINALLKDLVRYGPRWDFVHDVPLPHPLRFDELIISFPRRATDAVPGDYRLEEAAIERYLKWQPFFFWLGMIWPDTGKFTKVTLQVDEYERTWSTVGTVYS